MIKVGVTGCMGTGKATVAGYFERRGALVIDADQLARDAVSVGTTAWRGLISEFGEDILNDDGTIDRKKLSALVFSSPAMPKRINRIVHPPVIEMLKKKIREAEDGKGYRILVADVPLLYEAGLQDMFDHVVVVSCTREQQVERSSRRDRVSTEEVEKRINAQMPLSEKIKMADFVIDNSGTFENAKRQVDRVWEKMVIRIKK